MSEADPYSALFHVLSALPAVPVGRVLFINAQDGAGLALLPRDAVLMQPLIHLAAPLKALGYQVVSDIPDQQTFDAVIMLATKQHDETRGLMAQGLSLLKDAGWLIVAGANDAGGKRLAADFSALGLVAQQESRDKSRVVLARKDQSILPDVIATWIAAAAWQPALGGEFITRPGLFSWNRADPGSRLLQENIPATLHGYGADFGCGYGFLSAHILRSCVAVQKLYALDAHDWAVQACAQNTRFADARIECRTHDLSHRPDLPSLDFIVMNPPFHEGAQVQNQLGIAFIRHARACLKKSGVLYMVANNHLPYEEILRGCFTTVDEITKQNGFKIIKAHT